MQHYDITRDLDFVREYTLDNISFSKIDNSCIHGFGLFATEKILRSHILGTLDGQVVDWNQYELISRKLENDIGSYKNFIFTEWNALDKSTLLVRPLRTKYSFINHSYEPNLEIKYNPIRVVAIKDILKGEEFTLDYTKEPLRREYLEGHGKTYL